MSLMVEWIVEESEGDFGEKGLEKQGLEQEIEKEEEMMMMMRMMRKKTMKGGEREEGEHEAMIAE
jgi:hypothetical protein